MQRNIGPSFSAASYNNPYRHPFISRDGRV